MVYSLDDDDNMKKHIKTYNSVVSMFLAVPSMVEQYAEANLVII
jgi:hypothetical protein